MEKYRRSPLPLFKESQDKYLQEELKKLERVLESVAAQVEKNTQEIAKIKAHLGLA